MMAVSIECGSVFLFPEDSFVDRNPHYFVVLNNDPYTAVQLILVCATSQVVKRRAYSKYASLPKDTMVEITPFDCSIFPKPTIFDCNNLFIKSAQELLDKMKKGCFHYKGKIPNSLIKKLHDGVNLSPMVEEEIKQRLKI